MKKETIALLLLLFLIGLSVGNVFIVRGITEDISSLAESAERCALSGNWEASENAAETAVSLWEGSRGYTHMILEHTEHYAASDALYGLLAAVSARSPADVGVAAREVKSRFTGIRELEELWAGSVL